MNPFGSRGGGGGGGFKSTQKKGYQGKNFDPNYHQKKFGNSNFNQNGMNSNSPNRAATTGFVSTGNGYQGKNFDRNYQNNKFGGGGNFSQGGGMNRTSPNRAATTGFTAGNRVGGLGYGSATQNAGGAFGSGNRLQTNTPGGSGLFGGGGMTGKTSTFGRPNATTGSFNARSSTSSSTGIFGNKTNSNSFQKPGGVTGGFSQQQGQVPQVGTGTFQPVPCSETISAGNNRKMNVTSRLMAITAIDGYNGKSFEELRYEDMTKTPVPGGNNSASFGMNQTANSTNKFGSGSQFSSQGNSGGLRGLGSPSQNKMQFGSGFGQQTGSGSFRPVPCQESVSAGNNRKINVTSRLMAITAMDGYNGKSFEEIRLEDLLKGQNPNGSSMSAGTLSSSTGGFGQKSQVGGLKFGNQSQASSSTGTGFGTQRSQASGIGGGLSFGAKSQTTGTNGGFGQKATSTLGGFGQKKVGFGQTSTVGGFGTTQQKSTGGFGGFGANQQGVGSGFGQKLGSSTGGFGQKSGGFGTQSSSTSGGFQLGNKTQSSATTGFGQKAGGFGQKPGGFGQMSSGTSGGFGAQTQRTTGFGANKGVTFGSTTQISPAKSGFGTSSGSIGGFKSPGSGGKMGFGTGSTLKSPGTTGVPSFSQFGSNGAKSGGFGSATSGGFGNSGFKTAGAGFSSNKGGFGSPQMTPGGSPSFSGGFVGGTGGFGNVIQQQQTAVAAEPPKEPLEFDLSGMKRTEKVDSKSSTENTPVYSKTQTSYRHIPRSAARIQPRGLHSDPKVNGSPTKSAVLDPKSLQGERRDETSMEYRISSADLVSSTRDNEDAEENEHDSFLNLPSSSHEKSKNLTTPLNSNGTNRSEATGLTPSVPMHSPLVGGADTVTDSEGKNDKGGSCGTPSSPTDSRHLVAPKPIEFPMKMHSPSSPLGTPSDNGEKVVHVNNPLAPVLTKRDYDCYPSLSQLQIMTDEELAAVNNFVVFRPGIGQIKWEGKTDLRDVNIDDAVVIEHKMISVYDGLEEEDKPPRGQKLNKPAVVTLYEISPKTISAEAIEKFEKKLRNSCSKNESKFLNYDIDMQEWMFRVDHF